MKRFSFIAAALFATGIAAAQAPSAAPAKPAPPIVSVEVHADKRVTFRFRNPSAKEVVLSREGIRVPMTRDESGVWTVTTDPLAPDFYGYSFVADGISFMDPLNPLMKPNLLNPQSMVHVPGGQVWDEAGVPRGTVHRHFYRSKIVGDDRDYYVYTPAGYDPRAKAALPVLYLLHGFSDDASGWTAVGRAHVILDNLIAQGKARPMLVVMTLGYGAPEIVTRTAAPFRDPQLRQRSFDRYRDALFQEVIPEVEKQYRVSTNRQDRAIAGLSMGGAESLYVGLNALDKFAWIGAFSSGGLGQDLAAQFPKIDKSANEQLRLLWISCGEEDRLLDANKQIVSFLNSKGVNASLKVTPGAHQWMVWRRNLAELLPLLFQKKVS